MSAIALALALAVSKPAAPVEVEPLPRGAPTQPYPLAAWCYGALSEYLYIYKKVTPDLVAIDKEFGTSEPNEKAPYADDMAAAHVELRKIGEAVRAAEQASAAPIAEKGSAAMRKGRAIWAPAELQPQRKLADAWLTWALPDRCATNADALTKHARLLGQALKYNNPSALDSPASQPALVADAAPADAGGASAAPGAPAEGAAPTDQTAPLATPAGGTDTSAEPEAAGPAGDAPLGDAPVGDAPASASPDYASPTGDAPSSGAPAETAAPDATPAGDAPLATPTPSSTPPKR